MVLPSIVRLRVFCPFFFLLLPHDGQTILVSSVYWTRIESKSSRFSICTPAFAVVKINRQVVLGICQAKQMLSLEITLKIIRKMPK